MRSHRVRRTATATRPPAPSPLGWARRVSLSVTPAISCLSLPPQSSTAPSIEWAATWTGTASHHAVQVQHSSLVLQRSRCLQTSVIMITSFGIIITLFWHSFYQYLNWMSESFCCENPHAYLNIEYCDVTSQSVIVSGPYRCYRFSDNRPLNQR